VQVSEKIHPALRAVIRAKDYNRIDSSPGLKTVYRVSPGARRGVASLSGNSKGEIKHV